MWLRRIAKGALILCGCLAVGAIVLTITDDMTPVMAIRACIVIPFVALWAIRELRKPRNDITGGNNQ